MPALSSKDKLRLRLADQRVERWNTERRKPADNDVARCKGVVFAPNQDKSQEVIKPDGLDSVHRSTDGYGVRSMASKLGRHSNAFAARVHTVTHKNKDTGEVTTQVVMDHPDNDSLPCDPVWKQGLPKVAKARPDSPFKRAGKSASNVVIVRK